MEGDEQTETRILYAAHLTTALLVPVVMGVLADHCHSSFDLASGKPSLPFVPAWI